MNGQNKKPNGRDSSFKYCSRNHALSCTSTILAGILTWRSGKTRAQATKGSHIRSRCMHVHFALTRKEFAYRYTYWHWKSTVQSHCLSHSACYRHQCVLRVDERVRALPILHQNYQDQGRLHNAHLHSSSFSGLYYDTQKCQETFRSIALTTHSLLVPWQILCESNSLRFLEQSAEFCQSISKNDTPSFRFAMQGYAYKPVQVSLLSAIYLYYHRSRCRFGDKINVEIKIKKLCVSFFFFIISSLQLHKQQVHVTPSVPAWQHVSA